MANKVDVPNGTNIEYTPIDWKRTEDLAREIGAKDIAVTEKGLYRLFHNGYPHYFTRLQDTLDFHDFIHGGERVPKGDS